MASTPGFYKIKKGDDEFDDDLSEMDSVLDDMDLMKLCKKEDEIKLMCHEGRLINIKR